MARAAHPAAMAPSKPGRTRTAPPQMNPKFPAQGRYLSYMVFGACSVFFVVSSGVLLKIVWSLGSGPAAYTEYMAALGHPLYVIYHVLALLGFLYTGYRFFIKLFGKSQPPRVGPLPSPPPEVFPPMMVAAWVAASAAVLVVAWGILP